MKFVSLDFETTGTDPELDQAIEIGCVFVDTEKKIKKEFYKIISHNRYTGTPYALALNKRIFDLLAKGESEDIIYNYNLEYQLKKWIHQECGYEFQFSSNQNEIIFAGKNVSGFDLLFLRKIYDQLDKDFKVSYRSIDPAMFYLNSDDKKIPSLEECKKRAGYENTTVSHNALEDAHDVANLILDHLKINF